MGRAEGGLLKRSLGFLQKVSLEGIKCLLEVLHLKTIVLQVNQFW